MEYFTHFTKSNRSANAFSVAKSSLIWKWLFKKDIDTLTGNLQLISYSWGREKCWSHWNARESLIKLNGTNGKRNEHNNSDREYGASVNSTIRNGKIEKKKTRGTLKTSWKNTYARHFSNAGRASTIENNKVDVMNEYHHLSLCEWVCMCAPQYGVAFWRFVARTLSRSI